MHEICLKILGRITARQCIATGLLGLLGGGAGYLLSSSIKPQYEAIALLETHYVPVFKIESSTPVTVHPPIEDARYLMARLQFPSTYTPETLAACGLANDAAPGEALTNALIVSRERNLDTILKMKIRRSSPELATKCLVTIVESIKEDQDKISAATLDVIDKNIAFLEKRLKIEKAGMDSASPNELYIRRFETIDLNTQLNTLMQVKNGSKPAHLLSPIYASPKVAFPPSKWLTIPVGFIVGISVGLVFVFLSIWTRLMYINRSRTSS